MMTSEINTKEGRDWLKSVLQEREVTIFFIKKDGTERELRCTLAENKIPQEKLPKNSGKSKSDDSLAVFDVEKDAWRSFRWDSVKKIDFKI
jgi:hypothetical protein